jgi:hypothetical protein
MKTKTFKGTKTGKKILVERFDSLSELLMVGSKREQNFGEPRDSMAVSLGFPNWSTLEDAVFNDPRKISSLRNKVKAAYSTGVRRRDKLSVEGGTPCVPAYLIGAPTSMIRKDKIVTKGRFLQIVLDCCYPWTVSKKDVEEYYTGVVETIASLSAQGYRISITGFASFTEPHDPDASVVFVELKGSREKFNLKKLMFSLSHEAMLRGLLFDWYQRSGGVELYAYGTPVSYWSTRDKEDFLSDLGIKDTFISFKSDYKGILCSKN